MAIDKAWFDEMEARIPKGRVRTRFAPSPTGYMHVGNLRTALYTYLLAKSLGGDFLLRIEDTDQSRLVEGAVDIIYATMKKCGLQHDEGPDIGGPVGPYVQTERRDLYGKYAELLVEKGGAYYCFCDKINTHDAEGSDIKKHKCDCPKLTKEEVEAKIAAGVPYVIRQKIPSEGTTTFSDLVFGDIEVPNDSLDDNVLLKSDGLPTYNFANVVDDHLMGITHVVRGSEYLSSAPKYNLLYQSFGWEIPAYIHCAPVMRDAQHKMSKRNGDPSYEDLIEMGYLSEAVVNYVALLGWNPGGEREIYTLPELVEVFDVKGLSKSPAIFDINKLTYFNSEYIRALPAEEFAKIAEPYIRAIVTNEDLNAAKIAGILQQRCEKLTDITAEKIGFFEELPAFGLELFENKKSKCNKEVAVDMLLAVLPLFQNLPNWEQQTIHDGLINLAAELGVKNATLMWPIRIAVSGQTVTPGGAVEICHILGRYNSLSRISEAMARLMTE